MCESIPFLSFFLLTLLVMFILFLTSLADGVYEDSTPTPKERSWKGRSL